MEIGEALILNAASLLISFLGAFAAMRFAPRLGLVQKPNSRSSHSEIVPHGGGVGIMIAGSVAGGWLAFYLFPTFPLSHFDVSKVLAALGLAFPLAMTGLLDDVFRVPAGVRFAVQAACVIALLWFCGFAVPPRFTFFAGSEWLFGGMLVFSGIWWVNLFNFMDGIDGIAGAQAVSTLAAAAFLAWVSRPEALASPVWWLMTCAISATLGFLLLNRPPARIFMGDVGSTWLAFMIFAFALISIRNGWLGYPAWSILSAVFVCDATATLLTRMFRGERWYAAHRSHAYQRLGRLLEASAANGLSAADRRAVAHRKVTLGTFAINLLWLAPLACVAEVWPAWDWFAVAVAYLPIAFGVSSLGAGRRDHE